MAGLKLSQDYSHCHGCGLCTLVCPAWQQSRDVRGSPHGHAKAMKFGGDINVVGLFDCIFCGACEPVCPENIDILSMLIALRREAVKTSPLPVAAAEPNAVPLLPASSEILLLADESLLANEKLLAQVLNLLNGRGAGRVEVAQDHGNDIVAALQAGAELLPARVDGFKSGLKSTQQLIVSDGLLKRALQRWMPAMPMDSLGYALSSLPALLGRLRPGDLYVIESRAYNTDFERMVSHYDGLRRQSGCRLNLDLQRLAIPSGGIGAGFQRASVSGGFEPRQQAEWLLQGLAIDRIIVEHVDDGFLLAQVSDQPVMHVAELLAHV